MNVSYRIVGRNIRAARLRMGLTQQALAERLNMSLVHLGRMERGERPLSLAQVAQLAEALHVGAGELLRGCFDGEVLPVPAEAGDADRLLALYARAPRETQELMYSVCYLIAAHSGV